MRPRMYGSSDRYSVRSSIFSIMLLQRDKLSFIARSAKLEHSCVHRITSVPSGSYIALTTK